jgi:DNA-directed RNA polymerase specialized sigma54-like protein
VERDRDELEEARQRLRAVAESLKVREEALRKVWYAIVRVAMYTFAIYAICYI